MPYDRWRWLVYFLDTKINKCDIREMTTTQASTRTIDPQSHDDLERVINALQTKHPDRSHATLRLEDGRVAVLIRPEGGDHKDRFVVPLPIRIRERWVLSAVEVLQLDLENPIEPFEVDSLRDFALHANRTVRIERDAKYVRIALQKLAEAGFVAPTTVDVSERQLTWAVAPGRDISLVTNGDGSIVADATKARVPRVPVLPDTRVRAKGSA